MAKKPGQDPHLPDTPILPEEPSSSAESLLSVDSSDLSFTDIITEYQYTDATRTDTENRSLLSALLDSQNFDGASDEEPAPETSAEPDEPVPPPAPVPPEPDIMEQIARSLSSVAGESNAPSPVSPANDDGDTQDLSRPPSRPKVTTDEVSLGATGNFDKMFAPRNTYVGDDTEDWMPGERDKTSPSSILPALFYRKKKEPEPVLSVEEAHAHAQKQFVSLRLRSFCAFLVLIPLVGISAAQPYASLPSFLRYAEKPYLVLLILYLLQALVMLLGLDVLGKGAADLFRLRPGVETMTLLSCVATLLHGFAITDPFSLFTGLPVIAFLPYCAVSGAAVFFALWGRGHRFKAYMKTYKAAMAADEAVPDTVMVEENAWNGESGFSRQSVPMNDFTALCEQSDIVTKINRFITPLLIVLCFVLAWLAAAVHSDAQYFFWAFSALCCAAVPLTAFGPFSAVYSRIASRLAHVGAAITGWSAAVKLSRTHQILTRDTDLFPPGSLNLTGLRAFPPHDFDLTVLYCLSLLSMTGTGLYRKLLIAAQKSEDQIRTVQNFQAFESGISGEIDGRRIHMGTLNFMHSMAIHIPSEHNIKNAVYITVNLALAGIFPVAYVPAKQVEDALILLERQKIQSVLAVRDFNITPNMLKEKYGADPDLLEFPVVEDRFTLSSPERDFLGRPVAALSRDGLCPYAEAIVGGKRLHRYTLINLVIHLIALVFGMLVTFYFTRQTAPGAAMAISPHNLIGFMMIWWLIQWVISLVSHRY